MTSAELRLQVESGPYGDIFRARLALDEEKCTVDPTEAPEGFYAVPKKDLPHDRGNLCWQCDYRPQCGAMAGNRGNCSSAIVIGLDGIPFFRNDGVSVVFKALKTSTSGRAA